MPPKPESLAEIQRLMARAVMRPLTASEKMQRKWDDGRPTSDIASGLIKPNDRLTSFDRLEIYNRQYWFRLLSCLHDDYPGLRAVLGDIRFLRVATAYLQRYPSVSPNLRDLGSRLAQFIKEEPALTDPHTALCLDMARLEWAQVMAFDGEALRATTLKSIVKIAPDQIFLRLQPFITLLALSHPVDQVVIRLMHQDGELRSDASNAVDSSSSSRQRSIARHIRPAPTWLLVHRQENSVYFKKLTEPEYLILCALESGKNIVAACHSVEKYLVSIEMIQSWFHTWAELRFFASTKRKQKP